MMSFNFDSANVADLAPVAEALPHRLADGKGRLFGGKGRAWQGWSRETFLNRRFMGLQIVDN
jgi:hypothetical protein